MTVALAALTTLAGSAGATGSAEKVSATAFKTCGSVSLPGTTRTRVQTTASCATARAVIARSVKLYQKYRKTPTRYKGWKCSHYRGRGPRVRVMDCFRSKPSGVIYVNDDGMDIYLEYKHSTDTGPLSLGALLRWYAARICVLANQEHDQEFFAAQSAVAARSYDYLVSLLYSISGETGIPSAQEVRRCPDTPPTQNNTAYQMRYKQVLGFLGANAVDIAREGKISGLSLSDRASYGEWEAEYAYVLAQLAEADRSKVVTFAVFQSKMKTERVEVPPPSQPADDPPPCKVQGRPCGG